MRPVQLEMSCSQTHQSCRHSIIHRGKSAEEICLDISTSHGTEQARSRNLQANLGLTQCHAKITVRLIRYPVESQARQVRDIRTSQIRVRIHQDHPRQTNLVT